MSTFDPCEAAIVHKEPPEALDRALHSTGWTDGQPQIVSCYDPTLQSPRQSLSGEGETWWLPLSVQTTYDLDFLPRGDGRSNLEVWESRYDGRIHVQSIPLQSDDAPVHFVGRSFSESSKKSQMCAISFDPWDDRTQRVVIKAQTDGSLRFVRQNVTFTGVQLYDLTDRCSRVQESGCEASLTADQTGIEAHYRRV